MEKHTYEFSQYDNFQEKNMNVQLKTVTADQKEILNNLMEKYLYEFSEYDGYAFDETGLFRDSSVKRYFPEQNRYPYFIYVNHKLAGFAFVYKRAECDAPLDWAIGEFFVSYPYRKSGVGTIVMNQLFEQYKGIWQIKYHPKNTGSEIFWQKIANEASKDGFEIMRGKEDYYDGTPSKVLVFKV